MSHFSDSRDAILEAMRSTGREAAMRELWGCGFDSLLDYLALACAPQDVGIQILRRAVAQEACPTAIITGQRCSGDDIEGGTDSPVLLGVAAAANVLTPNGLPGGVVRNGGGPTDVRIHFSGGVRRLRHMGEIPGPVMAEQFNVMSGGRYARAVSADSYALNTGDQARVLAGILFAHRVQRVVVVHVVDHIARFAATVMAALRQMIRAENSRLEDLIGLYGTDEPEMMHDRVRAACRVMPEIVFVACGTWSDRDPRRGRGAGISRACEAFGPMQTQWGAICGSKLLGCEYADRYFAEQDPVLSIGYACSALSPAGMIRLIPYWVKDHLGYASVT